MAIPCWPNVLMVGSPCRVVEICEYTGLRAASRGGGRQESKMYSKADESVGVSTRFRLRVGRVCNIVNGD